MNGITQYVALLRAINVAGHAKVEMTRVRDAFSRAGCVNVQTYIQSGNVLFEASAEECQELFETIRVRVRALTGEQSTVIFRSARQLSALVNAAPFAPYESDRRLKLYAVCLAAKPRTTPPFPWHDSKERLDAIGIKGSDVLVVSRSKPNGFYGFPNAFVENIVGVPATSRNWNTVSRIAKLLKVQSSKFKVRK